MQTQALEDNRYGTRRIDPTALRALLRQATRLTGLVLAIEGLDETNDVWIELLRDLAPEIQRNRLVVATLRCPRCWPRSATRSSSRGTTANTLNAPRTSSNAPHSTTCLSAVWQY